MQLFVTYARDDIRRVEEIADVLRAGGHQVWVDDQLMPGQDWKQELARAIAAADAYLYALSRRSLDSQWCQWEFATAVSLAKPVIPAVLETGLQLPPALGALQHTHLVDGITPTAAAKLMGALALMKPVPRAQAPAAPAAPADTPSRAFDANPHWSDRLVTPRHAPQDDAEEAVGKFAANLWRGWEGVGGRIIVTNRRVLFEAHAFNLQRAPLAIDLADIVEVRLTRSLGIVPNGLTLRLRSGTEHAFVINGRERVRELIEAQRAALG